MTNQTDSSSSSPSPIRAAILRALTATLAAAAVLAAAAPVHAGAGVTVSFSIHLEGIAAPVGGPVMAGDDGPTGDASRTLQRLLDEVSDDSERARTALARDAVLWIDGRAFSSAEPDRVWTSGQSGRPGAHLSL